MPTTIQSSSGAIYHLYQGQCLVKDSTKDISYNILENDLGDSFYAQLLFGSQAGNREWKLTLPTLAGSGLANSLLTGIDGGLQTPVRYIESLYSAVKARGIPFAYQDPVTNQYYLVRFADPSLSIQRMLTRLYSSGVDIKQWRINGETVYDPSIPYEGAVGSWNDNTAHGAGVWNGRGYPTNLTAAGDVIDTGIKQVETATVVGTVTLNGNATVIITSNVLTGSPRTIPVAVLNTDTASTVAGKIRTALSGDAVVPLFFTVGGAGATVTLTSLTALDNDSTLNISINNGTCTGLTPALTSANTTAGIGTLKNGLKVWNLSTTAASGLFATGGFPSTAANDIFIVMKMREATFSNNAGILTNTSGGGSALLLGQSGTTKFQNRAFSNFEYRLNGVLYAQSNQQAPMNTWGIVHLRDTTGVSATFGALVNTWEIGKDRATAGTFANLDIGEVLMMVNLQSIDEVFEIVEFLQVKWGIGT